MHTGGDLSLPSSVRTAVQPRPLPVASSTGLTPGDQPPPPPDTD